MFKILIVDDSMVEIKIIRKLLGDEYQILTATSGPEALEIAGKTPPDLILLDIIMPEMDGFTVCRLLKAQQATANIPVVFITAISDVRNIVQGFEAGGQDYIVKPFYSAELCARVRVHLDLKTSQEAVLEYASKLEAKNQELTELLKKLETNAMTDFVTGLANRWNMMQWIKAETADAKQNKGKITLVLADVDNFKKVNDTYGHDCGDQVLKNIAKLMKSAVREETAIARWGGEEFLLMLPDADLETGQAVAERIRKSIETARFHYEEKTLSVTITLGVAELDRESGFDESIKKADEALYKGKRMSKNCVVAYHG